MGYIPNLYVGKISKTKHQKKERITTTKIWNQLTVKEDRNWKL